MKNAFIAIPLLLTLNIAIADEFVIKNDWYYAGIAKPAQQITMIENYDDGYEIQKTQTLFNDQGFITAIIYDDTLKQVFEPYNGKKREINYTYQVNDETQTHQLNTEWITANRQRFDDGDLITDTYYDDNGNITKLELFLDNTNIPEETIYYQYNDNDVSNESPNYKIISTLATDEFGSWTQQKEEKAQNKTIIRTRNIEYYP